MNTPPAMSEAPFPMAPIKSSRKNLNKLDIKPKKLLYNNPDNEMDSNESLNEEFAGIQEKSNKCETKSSADETSSFSKHVEQNELDNEAEETKIEHSYNLRQRMINQNAKLGIKKKAAQKKILDKENVQIDCPSTSAGSSKGIQLSQPGENETQQDKIAWLQNRRDVGIWVQCCDKRCLKWRFVEEFHDPVDVPDKWICALNSDKKFSSCKEPEDSKYNECKEDLIENKFTAGSIVWAKINEYPWWPGIIDDCPNTLRYYELKGKSQVPVKYHVTFFEEPISRAWIVTNRIKPLKKNDTNQPIKRPKIIFRGVNYKSDWKNSLQLAKTALPLSITQRLRKFSFVSRYSGPIIKPIIKRKSSSIGKLKSRKPKKIIHVLPEVSPRKLRNRLSVKSNVDSALKLADSQDSISAALIDFSDPPLAVLAKSPSADLNTPLVDSPISVLASTNQSLLVSFDPVSAALSNSPLAASSNQPLPGSSISLIKSSDPLLVASLKLPSAVFSETPMILSSDPPLVVSSNPSLIVLSDSPFPVSLKSPLPAFADTPFTASSRPEFPISSNPSFRNSSKSETSRELFNSSNQTPNYSWKLELPSTSKAEFNKSLDPTSSQPYLNSPDAPIVSLKSFSFQTLKFPKALEADFPASFRSNKSVTEGSDLSDFFEASLPTPSASDSNFEKTSQPNQEELQIIADITDNTSECSDSSNFFSSGPMGVEEERLFNDLVKCYNEFDFDRLDERDSEADAKELEELEKSIAEYEEKFPELKKENEIKMAYVFESDSDKEESDESSDFSDIVPCSVAKGSEEPNKRRKVVRKRIDNYNEFIDEVMKELEEKIEREPKAQPEIEKMLFF